MKKIQQINIVISLIFLFCQSLFAQEPAEIAMSLHNQLHNGEFDKAKSSLFLLKRKILGNLINPNISIFSEYIFLCEENGWYGKEKDEAELFVKMLKSVYSNSPEKLIKQIRPIVNNMCNYNNGQLAEVFFNAISDLLPIDEKLRLLYRIAWAYNYSETPYKAWYLFRECASNYKNLEGYEVDYARCLNGIAYVNRFIGQDEDALNLYQEIDPIYKEYFGEESLEYAINLDNIGRIFLVSFNDPKSALLYTERAYKIFDGKSLSDEHASICLNNIACCHGKMGNHERELEILLEAFDRSPGSNDIIANICRAYNRSNDQDKALEYFGLLSESYLESQAAPDYALNCIARNDLSGFIKYEGHYLDYLRRIMNTNFEDMIGTDREMYAVRSWNCDLDSLFRIGNRIQHPEITRLCYDCLLFQKSISLSCDKSIEYFVSSSSDSLKNIYDSLVMKKRKSNGRRELYEEEERSFLRALAKECNYTSFMSIRWSDILNGLSDNDVAIEFHVADEHDSNNIYAILLSRKDIRLICLGSSLEKSNISNIWQPLESYIKNADNIYFSPDGVLNTIPIESYTNSTRGQKFYRLSSTREILSDYTIPGKGAYIYGGLIYDAPVDSILKTNEKYQLRDASIFYGDRINLRGAVKKLRYLPGTEIEARTIANIISSSESKALGEPLLFSGFEGTEESFKDISGKRPKVIHIGTHGFISKKNQGSIQPFSRPDQALSKTGLILAGAYTADTDKYSIEDGILTAQEISMLDLRGLDLVALSACETGLGELSSDGVIGLQRGFKKAGAKTILMSLWKVDDEATSILMTEFYRNWINGNSKHESLERAKNVIKNRSDKGWDNPFYWSAFILLDGID